MSTMHQRLLALAFATLAVGMPLHAQRKTNLLTADEIERAKLRTSTAYEVVEMLRPRWLSRHELARIPGTPTEALQDVSVRVRRNGSWKCVGTARPRRRTGSGPRTEMRPSK